MTGLRYLIVPIRSRLDQAAVVPSILTAPLQELDAEFAYLLDLNALEGRHWENDGSAEDIATGSAAGAVGAFLVHSRLAANEKTIVLRQGRFLDRPSMMHVTVHGQPSGECRVEVAGPVTILAHGTIQADLTAATL